MTNFMSPDSNIWRRPRPRPRGPPQGISKAKAFVPKAPLKKSPQLSPRCVIDVSLLRRLMIYRRYILRYIWRYIKWMPSPPSLSRLSGFLLIREPPPHRSLCRRTMRPEHQPPRAHTPAQHRHHRLRRDAPDFSLARATRCARRVVPRRCAARGVRVDPRLPGEGADVHRPLAARPARDRRRQG